MAPAPARFSDLDEHKRPAYVAALAVLLPVVVLVMLTAWDSGGLARVAYPALLSLMVLAGLGLLSRRVSVPVAERAALVLVPLLGMARLVTTLYVDGDLAAARDAVTVSVVPAATVAIIVLYLTFDARLARRLALGLTGLLALLAAPGTVAALLDGGASADALALVGMLAYLAVVALLLSVLAKLREQAAQHGQRADDLDRSADTDPVTGIANRRRAEEALAEHLAWAERFDRPLGVALVDLDGFQRVNDSEGPAAGDAALLDVIEALQDDLRQTDLLARWGGDELLIIAPETDLDALRASAERWRACVADLTIPTGEGSLTASIGLTTRHPEDSVEEMTRRADDAMFLAKGEGRDRTVAT